MNDPEPTVFDILQLWREALKKGLCVLNWHILEDGKTFDYNLKDEKDYNCKDCKAPFCFKSLEWLDDVQDDVISQKASLLKEKELEVENMLYT